jgi:hypothetical protein
VPSYPNLRCGAKHGDRPRSGAEVNLRSFMGLAEH